MRHPGDLSRRELAQAAIVRVVHVLNDPRSVSVLVKAIVEVSY